MSDYNFSFEVNQILHEKDQEIERLKNRILITITDMTNFNENISYVFSGDPRIGSPRSFMKDSIKAWINLLEGLK